MGTPFSRFEEGGGGSRNALVVRSARAALKGHKPAVVWLTGLSGAGKTTIARHAEALLIARGAHTMALDGDILRSGLNQDLSFGASDRKENVRRVAEVAKLMTDAGLIVLCALISPYRAERDFARSLFEKGAFVEAFVDTPIEVCMARDPKGLYRRALAGELRDFTGIDQRYEPPLSPELTLRTVGRPAEELAEELVKTLAPFL